MATTMAVDDDDKEVNGDGATGEEVDDDGDAATGNEVDDDGSGVTGYDDDDDGDHGDGQRAMTTKTMATGDG